MQGSRRIWEKNMESSIQGLGGLGFRVQGLVGLVI